MTTKPVCSPEIEKLGSRQSTNHLYNGHRLQPTYIAGYFFFF